MVKATDTRKPRAKVIKKVKKVNTGPPKAMGKDAKASPHAQIIKQKVVVNVGKTAPKRRGRPKATLKKDPIYKPQSTPVIAQFPFYDQVRASTPYVEEIQADVKRLKAENESNTKYLLGMQQHALLQQLYNQQPQSQPQQIENDYYPQTSYEELPDEALNVEQKRLEALQEAKRLNAEKNALIKANKQAGAAKAREARAKLNEQRGMMEQEDINSRVYRASMRENDKLVSEAKKEELKLKKEMAKTLADAATKEVIHRKATKEADDEKAVVEAAKLAAKAERAAKKAAKKAAQEAAAEAERQRVEAEKAAAKNKTPQKKGRGRAKK